MRLLSLLAAVLFVSATWAGQPAPERPDDMLTEAQVMEYLAINQLTFKTWMAKGYLKPYGTAAQMFFRRDNVEAVKKASVDYEKKVADKGTDQINDRNFGRDQRDNARAQEQANRGAGATADQRVGADNKVDYRAAELEARRKEAATARDNRSGRVTDDRQGERDRAARDRDRERDAMREKRL